jgi:hypothetical protein
MAESRTTEFHTLLHGHLAPTGLLTESFFAREEAHPARGVPRRVSQVHRTLYQRAYYAAVKRR